MNARATALAATLLLGASGCIAQPTVGEYSVGGTVTGLQGQGVLLTDAAGSGVFVSSNGRFVIENAFVDGAAYDIAVASDPAVPSTRCKVLAGKGVIEGADVDNVTIACSRTTFTLGGKVTGLHSVGLVLDARGEAIALSQDGTFTFRTPITDGSSYLVAVTQQPEGATCTVSDSAGAIDGADITNVLVICTDNPTTPTASSDDDEEADEAERD